jgi:DNA helicase-4
LGYVLSQPETYPFAEERRLFYVAITRAKKHTYVLYKESCPSPFIADINQEEDNHNAMLCPMCRSGILKEMKSGETPFNKWSFYACTNKTAACPYTWFVNYGEESEILTQYRALSNIKGTPQTKL